MGKIKEHFCAGKHHILSYTGTKDVDIIRCAQLSPVSQT